MQKIASSDTKVHSGASFAYCCDSKTAGCALHVMVEGTGMPNSGGKQPVL